MRGLMSEQPLLVSTLIQHAARFHGDVEIVSRMVDGAVHRYGCAEAERRSRRLARALLGLGIAPGDRVGTLAWNNYRHIELYYGVSGNGAVCHTINPRLFDEQIVYIVNHAKDRLLFIETSFIPLVERLAPQLPADCRFVLLDPEETRLPVLATYDELVAAKLSVEEIRARLGVDSLHYLSIDGMVKSTGLPQHEFCRVIREDPNRRGLLYVGTELGIHVSFDLDVCDPAIAPGVGTPVRGGLNYREAHMAMEILADSRRVMALDLVEVNPVLDLQNTTAVLAAELAASALGQRIL